jgi:hypothetical protein
MADRSGHRRHRRHRRTREGESEENGSGEPCPSLQRVDTGLRDAMTGPRRPVSTLTPRSPQRNEHVRASHRSYPDRRRARRRQLTVVSAEAKTTAACAFACQRPRPAPSPRHGPRVREAAGRSAAAMALKETPRLRLVKVARRAAAGRGKRGKCGRAGDHWSGARPVFSKSAAMSCCPRALG